MNNTKIAIEAYEDNAGTITLLAYRGSELFWGMEYNGVEAVAAEDFHAIAFDGRDPVAEGWDNIVDDPDDFQVSPCDYDSPIASIAWHDDGTPFVLWDLRYAGGGGQRFAREFNVNFDEATNVGRQEENEEPARGGLDVSATARDETALSRGTSR